MAEAGQVLRCTREDHSLERLRDDSIPTETSAEQKKVESSVGAIYTAVRTSRTVIQLRLERELHSHYLRKGLQQLSDSYECLDASRPWLCYWIVHSLTLLDEPIPESVASKEKLQEFLCSLKQPDGSFNMHIGGEVDVRSAYCAASVASLTNIMTPKLFDGTAEWIARCQIWEGGIGGVPGMEAHGGYTFCGLAALVILKRTHLLDLKSLLRWVAFRQMRFEGGFQGRCNKLVDGCYSFWQAGLMPLLHRTLYAEGDSALSHTNWMFNQHALQEYILLCCQCPSGGLLDKPGKSRDFYHTCYCLSGLSMAQHYGSGEILHETIIGVPENSLKPTHPVYNIGPDKVAHAIMHFMEKEIPDMAN
ncbi:protein farnesyltransferase subunit beta isoform X3 [Pseudophryne corroboree]|uniref:protein farnesyltransferase subunit beta isoform X3 n=1 Tax=Pseudophryne corroboree TaxID=495146 RepID=UPI003081B69F